MKKSTLILLSLITGSLFSQITKSLEFFYPPSEHSPNDIQRNELKILIDATPFQASKITIVSSTDTVGNAENNLALCKKRAKVIYDLLKQKYSTAKYTVKFVGESSKYTDLDKNRSCKVLIEYDLFKTPKKEQVSHINNHKDTTLNLASGITIQIEANSFDKSYTEVTLKTKDFVKYSDLLAYNMTTESDGEQLASLGMVEVRAFANDKELELNPDKKITLMFPQTDTTAGFQLFDADTVNGKINWIKQYKEPMDTLSKLVYDFETLRSEHIIYTAKMKQWKQTLGGDTNKYRLDTLSNKKLWGLYRTKHINAYKERLDTIYYINDTRVNYVYSPKFEVSIDSLQKMFAKANLYNKYKLSNKKSHIGLAMKVDRNGYIKKISPTNLDSKSENIYLMARKVLSKYKRAIPAHKNHINCAGVIDIGINGNLDTMYIHCSTGYQSDEWDSDTLQNHLRKMIKLHRKEILLSHLGASSSNYRSFRSSRLGLINCDRFVKEPKTNLVCKLPDAFKTAKVDVIYKSMKSYMSYQDLDNGNIKMKAIPKDKNVILMARFKDEQGKNSFKIASVNTNCGTVDFRKIKDSSEEEILKLMETLENL